MTKLNISQAAKTFGKDWKTIKRHIEKGKVSCEIDKSGHKQIDLSELIRAYGEPKNNASPNAIGQNKDIPEHSSPNAIGIYGEKIGRLEAEITELKEDREERRERELRLEGEKKELRAIIDKQTALLLPKPEEAQPVPPQKIKPLTWLNAALIGCGVVGTGVGITAVFVTWVLPHIG